MILGFVLILIVLIPFCIYLYLTNKELKIKVEKLEQERKEILERKIKINKEQDTLSIENVSKEIIGYNTKNSTMVSSYFGYFLDTML